MLWTCWLWMAVAAVGAEEPVGIDEPPMFEAPAEPEVEERSYALAKILRCPVCQGLSVADSRSDAAVAMKNRIEELVSMGYSDEQIIDYFVGRYGEFTLLKPKYEHRFVWIAPIVASVLGVGVVLVRVRQQSTNSEEVPSDQERTDQQSSYRQQILAELEED